MAVLLVLLVIVLPTTYASGSGVLIVNENVATESLTKTEVMNIFLGKKATWENGNKITFVTLKDGDTHKTFLRTYIRKTPEQFNYYWKRMLFTGKGVIPKSFESDQEVIEFVSRNKNTVGYLSNPTTAAGIKMISIAE